MTELEPDFMILEQVAAAVSLQEGDAGVLRVLRALATPAPSSTRAVSRASGLPVPVVAAIQNELRDRGQVTSSRPAALSDAGWDLVRRLCLVAPGELPEFGFGGRGSIPAELEPVVERLAVDLAEAPPVDLTLDQSFCTARTKVRRVLQMIASGGLPAPGLLAVGDDDLISLAVVAVGDHLGVPLAGQIVVADISAELLGYLDSRLGGTSATTATTATRGSGVTARGPRVELVQHDLRDPLPAAVRNRCTVAMTDPPYTVPGARLFLTRAVEGLRPGPGRDVYLHLGPKGPGEWWQICRDAMDLGLVTVSMTRNFSDYEGSGVLGGTSHLTHWSTTELADRRVDGDTSTGRYQGPLYTADLRAAGREFTCTGCRARYVVGPGRTPSTVGELKAAGCPACGAHRFRPGRLEPPTSRS